MKCVLGSSPPEIVVRGFLPGPSCLHHCAHSPAGADQRGRFSQQQVRAAGLRHAPTGGRVRVTDRDIPTVLTAPFSCGLRGKCSFQSDPERLGRLDFLGFLCWARCHQPPTRPAVGGCIGLGRASYDRTWRRRPDFPVSTRWADDSPRTPR